MTALTAQALDDYADTYYLNAAVADVPIEELGQRRSADRTVAALHGAARVLEMGFGTGLMTAELLARDVPIEVLEGAPKLCAVARAAHPGLTVHEALFEEFVPERPYDAVLALHIAEHVDDPVALFRLVHNWLAPGGAIVVMVPNARSLHRRLAVRMGLQPALDTLSARDHLVGHQRVYDLATLWSDLAQASFHVEEEFGYQLKTVPNGMMGDWPMDLHAALVDVSPELAPDLLANIGVRAVRA
ncbi:Trans-aconitate 2-methyltransferase [Paraconexibacter sp. AEG42_29]|uniref:Trans-aconitate 2-methyltransferase n=1 Tax=Paraconexibacter sp. AEG42_29 TaxID=2997339 RepID=A0AAU7B027_9ACTN